MNTISMSIDGEHVPASNRATFERRNPLDGSVATTAAAATAADATAAVDAAARAFPTWSAMGPGERRALLLKAAQALEARGAAFAETLAAETGASAMWAGFNVQLAAGMLVEAASLTTQISAARSFRPTSPAASRWACGSPPVWCSALRRGMRR